MKSGTRIVLLGGFAVLAIGLVVSGVAFVRAGLPASAVTQAAPNGLQYVPHDASLLAYANVRDVMASGFRDSLRALQPGQDGQQEFLEQTGIDIESDIDAVMASLVTDGDSPSGLVLLTGRFDMARLEELAREQGGSVEEYAEHRLLTRTAEDGELAMSFVKPDVLALGAPALIRRAIDQASDRLVGDVTTNDRLMGLMTHVRETDNAWVVAQLAGSGVLSWLPDDVAAQMPPIAAMAAGMRFDRGLSATLTVEAADEQSGENLQAVVQGFVAFARMQISSRPAWQGLLDSIQLLRTGTIVTVTFDVPPETLQSITPDSLPR